MAGRILVGTASWSDPGFVEHWYPKKMAAADRLPYYAEHFNFVELNSSFYGIPNEKQVARWCDQTPKGFVFDVKLHKFLSRHGAGPQDLPPDLRKDASLTPSGKVQLTPELEQAVAERFLREIEPFRLSGKLGALLLQLSPSFSPRGHRLTDLDNLLDVLREYPIAIELRNKNWVAEDRLSETEGYFRERQLTFVAVDAPDTPHFMAMPYVNWVTNPDLAYMRLHGRNAEGYISGKTVAARFNYLYSEEELQEIATKAKELSQRAKETHIVYNNNSRDYAIRSAKRFRELIDQQTREQEGRLNLPS